MGVSWAQYDESFLPYHIWPDWYFGTTMFAAFERRRRAPKKGTQP
jgi:hypothetical protein